MTTISSSVALPYETKERDSRNLSLQHPHHQPIKRQKCCWCRGIRTEKGDYNRRIIEKNKMMRQVRAQVTRLNTWSRRNMANRDTEIDYDVAQLLEPRYGRTQRQATGIQNRKAAAQRKMDTLKSMMNGISSDE